MGLPDRELVSTTGLAASEGVVGSSIFENNQQTKSVEIIGCDNFQHIDFCYGRNGTVKTAKLFRTVAIEERTAKIIFNKGGAEIINSNGARIDVVDMELDDRTIVVINLREKFGISTIVAPVSLDLDSYPDEQFFSYRVDFKIESRDRDKGYGLKLSKALCPDSLI